MTRDLERIRFVTQHFHGLQGLRYGVPLGLITLSWGLVASGLADPLLAAALHPAAFLLMFGAGRYYRATFGEVERWPADGAAALQPSFFSPTPTPRFQSFSPMTPAIRHSLITMGTALAFLLIVLAFAPNIKVHSASWLTLDDIGLFGTRPGRPFWRISRPVSYGAVFAQAVCALYGSFFLGVWLRRERRPSQQHYLAFGIALLGLGAFGALLGYLVGRDTEAFAGIINLMLPAAVHPWVALLLCGSAMVVASLLDHWQLVRALGRPAEEEEP